MVLFARQHDAEMEDRLQGVDIVEERDRLEREGAEARCRLEAQLSDEQVRRKICNDPDIGLIFSRVCVWVALCAGTAACSVCRQAHAIMHTLGSSFRHTTKPENKYM